MTTSPQRAQREFDRERINKADPVGFLIAVMNAEPLPIRDQFGAIIGWQKADDVALRTAAAEKLLRRVVPELSSVSVENTGEGVQFVVTSPFALPGSQRPSLAAPELEPKVLPPEPEPGPRKRRRRSTQEDQA